MRKIRSRGRVNLVRYQMRTSRGVEIGWWDVGWDGIDMRVNNLSANAASDLGASSKN